MTLTLYRKLPALEEDPRPAGLAKAVLLLSRIIPWSVPMAPLSSVWPFVVILVASPAVSAGNAPLLIAQARGDGEKQMNCYIASRKTNRENTRINCVYKCPNGKTEAEVVPRGVSCPPFVNVAK